MNAIITTVRELWGLFVDDGSLALALVLWCGTAGLILPRALPWSEWNGALFFLGCLIILLTDVAFAARRIR